MNKFWSPAVIVAVTVVTVPAQPVAFTWLEIIPVWNTGADFTHTNPPLNVAVPVMVVGPFKVLVALNVAPDVMVAVFWRVYVPLTVTLPVWVVGKLLVNTPVESPGKPKVILVVLPDEAPTFNCWDHDDEVAFRMLTILDALAPTPDAMLTVWVPVAAPFSKSTVAAALGDTYKLLPTYVSSSFCLPIWYPLLAPQNAPDPIAPE